MTTRRLLAALAALSLSLAPDSAFSGPKVRIRDDQYSGFISGASFTTGYEYDYEYEYYEDNEPEWYSDEDYPDDETQVPEGWPTNWVEILNGWTWYYKRTATNHVQVAAPWSGSNETWTSVRGFSPHYWSSTSGVSCVALSELADARHTHAWQHCTTPPVYSAAEYTGYDYPGVYQHYTDRDLQARQAVCVETPAWAPSVCRFDRDGASVQVGDTGVFFDAVVALELYPPGDENRPSPDPAAKVAIYAQEVLEDPEHPALCVVARDWDTGEVRHYRAGDSVARKLERRSEGLQTFLCGRVVVRFARTPYAKGTSDPVICVYANDADGGVRAGQDAEYPGAADALRPDFEGLALFRPLAQGGSFALSRVSYSGSVRLGAYVVTRADPLDIVVRRDAGFLDRMYDFTVSFNDGSTDYWADDTVQKSYRFSLYSPAFRYDPRLDFAWSGRGGWSDGYYPYVRASGGYEVVLDDSCFTERATAASAGETRSR